MLGTTGALVTLVDRDRQVFAGCVGVGEPWLSRGGTPLSHSFCQHAVQSREPLLVSDARDHPVLRFNRAVGELGLISYAGIPLIDDAGHALGSLCVFDTRPRSWTPDDVATLEDLAASAMTEIRLRAVDAA
jgi:GAF domain-containing protein